MRRGLSFVLVLLLVLRGLLGDAMAMGAIPVTLPTAPAHQHATVTTVATELATASHHQDHAGIHEPRATAVSGCAVNDADVTDCGQGSEHTCSACGICHTALFTGTADAQAPVVVASALHPMGLTPFASAAAALAIKPPIS